MERAAVDRELSATVHCAGDYEYRVATRADDALVRDILARVAMDGRIRVSFQREPDAFATSFGALSHDYLLARHRNRDEYIGVCERVVREAFVNGERCRLPYLAALRVLPEFRHRLAALRGGYQAVRELLGSERDPRWSLTSILSDNAPARRLLGANLRGMPRYEPLGELSTFVLTARRGTEPERAADADLPRIAELLLQRGRETQFASVWSLERLRGAVAEGWLRAEDFIVLRREGAIRACAAVWDLSRFRQLVIAGYAPWLARMRWLVNAGATLLGMPRLPPPGERLRAAYLSFVVVDDAAPGDLLELVGAARAEAARRGLALLFLGWQSEDPLAAALRQLRRRREHRAQLYIVRWPEDSAPALDPRLRLAPELALM